MTDIPHTFLQGATAFKNARDWTTQHRNTAIARANETVAQRIEGEENEEDKEDEEDDDEDEDEDEAEAGLSSTTFSFACGADPRLNTLAEDGESEASVEGDSSHPPAKRSSSKSH